MSYSYQILQDEDAGSPDSFGDDAVFLVAFHGQFWVEREGFSQGELTPEDDQDRLSEITQEYEVYPLGAHIHSGVHLFLGTQGSCPWDSGQVGYILVKRSEVPETQAAALALIEDWNVYLSGQVTGFVVRDHNDQIVDSCWGFYDREYCESEAKASMVYLEAEDREETDPLLLLQVSHG